MAIEYKATVTYPAGELTYSFPFLYLRKEFVKVAYLNEDGTTEDLTYNQDYSIEGQTLTLNEAGESTATIRIYRQTPTDRIIEFVDASILKAYDLNTIDIQLLHIAEENADYCVLNNMVLDEDNAWHGHGHRLKNIADPEDGGDVLTLHYWQNVLDPAWRDNIYTRVAAAATEIANTIYNQVNSIIASASQTIQNNVQGSVNAAAASATSAAESSTAASNSATAAAESASNALTDATAAASSAQAAAASEANAQLLVSTVNPPWNVRLNNTAYEVGYLACSAALPSNIRIECITAGTSGATEPDFSGAIAGNTVTDGTVVWLYTDIRGLLPHVTIHAPTGCTITMTQGATTLTATEDSGEWQFNLPRLGDWTLTCTFGERSATKVVHVTSVRDYTVQMSYGYRYGYRIKKNESNPATRVEYLYDAVGITPAHMDFTTGIFDYGGWGDKWFVTDNKPLMLKNNGLVDYYLDPNNYDKREGGELDSDVSNTAYDGNAMAQFPLVYVYRYEDNEYLYEIVSDVQYDENYKAYAHTRADGSIADYFYWSLFGGSGNSSKIRSLAGQTLAQSLTAQQEINGCTANGSVWYTHTWSQHELIRTLLVLMGKSTDTQSVFGYGNCRSASAASGMLTTGTLKTAGQFYGYSNFTSQVKVFHVEKFWGDQWDRLAGFMTNGYKAYVKMAPEDAGYRVTDTNGYTDTGITVPSMSASYISGCSCTEYGMIPTAAAGSTTTYFCDGGWSASGLMYLIVGASAAYASAFGGAFCFNSTDAASVTAWGIGCGLSAVQPAAA